jgi:hypothetical protein
MTEILQRIERKDRKWKIRRVKQNAIEIELPVRV